MKKFSVGAIVAAGIAVVALVGGLIFYGVVNSTRGTLISQENALVAQYQDNQNELSAFILKFKETLGIADRQTDKLDEILTNAVKGRYDNDTSLQPGTGGSMFSAIAEAYPDLTATTESYIVVQNLIIEGRDAYKNKQTVLLDMIKTYKDYINKDLFRLWVINTFLGGAPTDNLEVTVAGVAYTGSDALTKISQIVLVQEAEDAYETGKQEPLIVPDEDK